ncbi:hypothetical protein NDU88_004933 [Pleurodeles waltl]|uniref:Transposase n=1 Tax=Pleurodeles waltl TaxID=8319 RepID=A0AAV7MFF7_PLEWA|nr:hypothetical protein NDU88_004933 [Pleurodeles waltl]
MRKRMRRRLNPKKHSPETVHHLPPSSHPLPFAIFSASVASHSDTLWSPTCTGEPAMPRGKKTDKATGKPARQLLFSEALCQQKHSSAEDPPPLPRTNMADDTQGATMEHILQEILAVRRKLEGMDSAMVALTAEPRSMRLDIVGFQSQISGLDQRVATVETQVASRTDRDLEFLHLRSKLTDLEDRSRRNNVRLFRFPEGVKGAEIFSYLRDILPKLTDITFDPPLEFQRAHRLGPKRQDGNGRPVQL